MSGPELRVLIDRLAAKESGICSALIAADRGHERPSETREIAKSGDALAQKAVAAWEAAALARQELNARLEYSGTHRPIKRVVW
jgi:hypothetical protein